MSSWRISKDDVFTGGVLVRDSRFTPENIRKCAAELVNQLTVRFHGNKSVTTSKQRCSKWRCLISSVDVWPLRQAAKPDTQFYNELFKISYDASRSCVIMSNTHCLFRLNASVWQRSVAFTHVQQHDDTNSRATFSMACQRHLLIYLTRINWVPISNDVINWQHVTSRDEIKSSRNASET